VPFLQAMGILGAGIAAGTINTVVGSGTLVTFPVLVAFGYAPVVANVSNTVGLVPGAVAGAVGYRRELRGQRRRALPLMGASVLGGIGGATLLLVLSAASFKHVAPWFIALALALILAQPALSRFLARRRPPGATAGPWTLSGVLATGIYGGYFGGAQSILLLAILGLGLEDELQRINALKVVLAGLVNLVAGLAFVVAADVNWGVAALIAGGSTAGGLLGARIGRRLSPGWLRAMIVVVGVLGIVRLLT
jgi:uncharacterized membrane protein YfcA